MVTRVKFIASASMIAPLLFALFICSEAAASCLITRDDGRTFTSSAASCTSFYVPEHKCSNQAHNDALPSCAALNTLVTPQWASHLDMVLSPHRGLWGGRHISGTVQKPFLNLVLSLDGADDIPQNAPIAFTQAVTSGLSYVEMDVVFGKESADAPVSEGLAVLGHYMDVFSASDGQATRDIDETYGWTFTDLSEIQYGGLNLRGNWLRNTSANIDEKWFTFRQFVISYVSSVSASNRMIMVIDPKPAKPYNVNGQCIYFCYDPFVSTISGQGEIYRKIVASVIETAFFYGLTDRIIIKAPQKWITYEQAMAIPYARSVLWVPQPTAGQSQQQTFTYLDKWASDPKIIAFYEPIVTNSESWMAKPFSRNSNEKHPGSYADISDYVASALSSRIAIWVISPAGQLGKQGEYFSNNEYLGNDANNVLGNMMWGFSSMAKGSHAVITTDVPFSFAKIRAQLFNASNSQ